MRFDLPAPQADTQPFWDAAREHRLLIQRCVATGRHYFYPRPFDPQTWDDDVEWVEASGRATLYTYAVVHQNDLPPWPARVPYVVAIVELEEGPRMATNVVDCALEDVQIGMALEVTWRELDDEFTAPVFRPAGTSVPPPAPLQSPRSVETGNE